MAASPLFIVLSFEGPDRCSQAGGLGTRITGLTEALADLGLESHLFFVGDPDLPGHEIRRAGRLQLHRWCQWISRFHPGGVYEAEDRKLFDWNRSLPPWIESHVLGPAIASGRRVVLMGEEWQTAETIVSLRRIAEKHRWQDHVTFYWNANHVYGFDRVDWEALPRSALITTVSSHMQDVLARRGIAARVVPNGIPAGWLRKEPDDSYREIAHLFAGRLALVKVARWDPDKGWIAGVEAAADLKRSGQHVLLVVRGGSGPYQSTVVDRARQCGLTVAATRLFGADVGALASAIDAGLRADVVVIDGFLSFDQRKALYRAADAVLANSRFEPFGLVGLEAMASGGVAVVGHTEDYAEHGRNAIRASPDDHRGIARELRALRRSPGLAMQLRSRARQTARSFAWGSVIRTAMLPALGMSVP